MFMFFYIFLYFRMYNYMNLCTNKGKNIIKITIKLMIQILQIQILRPTMLTNFAQNWREHCIGEGQLGVIEEGIVIWKIMSSRLL